MTVFYILALTIFSSSVPFESGGRQLAKDLCFGLMGSTR